jgi:DNA polymerase-3 subunit delta
VSVHLVRGADPILRDRSVDALVVELLDGEDAGLAVEQLTIPGRAAAGSAGGTAPDDDGGAGRDAVVAALMNAVSSPPFMTAHRVVVVRDVGALTAGDAEALVRYLDDPLETTRLVLVAGGGTIPVALTKKLQTVGVDDRAPASERTADVLAEALGGAGVRLRPDAAKLVADHLGDDAGRADALAETLRAAHGDGATLGIEDVGPYLGEAGAVPTFRLTTAIENGDVAGALEALHRLLTVSSPQQPRPMHPLQVMGVLHGQYRRVLRLDDPALRSPADAVAALGGRVKEFPARKALDQARALGTDGIREAFDHLEQADLDLKGARGIPEETVMEVLVARLAALQARKGAGRGRAPRRR